MGCKVDDGDEVEEEEPKEENRLLLVSPESIVAGPGALRHSSFGSGGSRGTDHGDATDVRSLRISWMEKSVWDEKVPIWSSANHFLIVLAARLWEDPASSFLEVSEGLLQSAF